MIQQEKVRLVGKVCKLENVIESVLHASDDSVGWGERAMTEGSGAGDDLPDVQGTQPGTRSICTPLWGSFDEFHG